MSLQIKFHESTNQILVYNCEPTIQWCKNPVSLLKGFLCYIFTPVSESFGLRNMLDGLKKVSYGLGNVSYGRGNQDIDNILNCFFVHRKTIE